MERAKSAQNKAHERSDRPSNKRIKDQWKAVNQAKGTGQRSTCKSGGLKESAPR